MRPSWDTFYMSMCYLIAYRSPDESTKVGSVITTKDNVLLSQGYNGLPRGMDAGPEVQIRPDKYFLFEHAERNALYNAARHGHSTQGCTIYVHGGHPCSDCTKGIIQAGIVRVVHSPSDPAFMARWADHIRWSQTMFDESGVEVVERGTTSP